MWREEKMKIAEEEAKKMCMLMFDEKKAEKIMNKITLEKENYRRARARANEAMPEALPLPRPNPPIRTPQVAEPPSQQVYICNYCSEGIHCSNLHRGEYQGSHMRKCKRCSKRFRVLFWERSDEAKWYAGVCYSCARPHNICQFCEYVYPREKLKLCIEFHRYLKPVLLNEPPSMRPPLQTTSYDQTFNFNIKYELENTNSSLICEACSGLSTKSRSKVDIYYKECMICTKPFLIRYWMPTTDFFDYSTKKAAICYACSSRHGKCQFCASSAGRDNLKCYASVQLNLRYL